jgi:hypothetical protein
VSLQIVKTASRDQKQTSQTPAHQPKTARQHLAGEPENKKPGFFRSLYSRLAGYEDLNDATRLASDPTFRLMGSEKVWQRGVALTSTLHCFETDLLTWEENLTGLATLNRELVAQAEGVGSPHRVVLDMDSSESPVYGAQEQSAYNGYLGSACYHPLFLFNRQGDCLAAKLRPGNEHSAEGWEELLLPEIERQQQNGKQMGFRGDAAFAKPDIPGTG